VQLAGREIQSCRLHARQSENRAFYAAKARGTFRAPDKKLERLEALIAG
jgi:hypothetical protein